MILSSTPQLTIIPTHEPIDARAAMWYHVPYVMLLQLPKKGVADLFASITMHVQMHVHNGSKNFSLRSYKYVRIPCIAFYLRWKTFAVKHFYLHSLKNFRG